VKLTHDSVINYLSIYVGVGAKSIVVIENCMMVIENCMMVIENCMMVIENCMMVIGNCMPGKNRDFFCLRE